MKMKFVVTLVTLLSFLGLTAQESKKFVIELKDTLADVRPALPFGAIKVIDARFDRNNIGCVAKDFSFSGRSTNKTEAVFPDSFATYLSQSLAKLTALDVQSPDTLVMIVKRFRLADYISNIATIQNSRSGQNAPLLFDITTSQNHRTNKNVQLILDLSVSFYLLKAHTYSKLFSIDDLVEEDFSKEKHVSKQDAFYSRERALTKVLTNVLSGRNWQVSSAASFSGDDIEKGLAKRFDLPVLKDSVYPVGLYRNFSEFMRNSPSVRGILFKGNPPDAIGDSTGNKIDITAYWGMSDGKKRYILFRSNLYELSKSDRAFKFTSYRTQQDLSGGTAFGNYATQRGLIPALITRANEVGTFRETFYLNMDKGEIYLDELFGKSGLKAIQKDILR